MGAAAGEEVGVVQMTDHVRGFEDAPVDFELVRLFAAALVMAEAQGWQEQLVRMGSTLVPRSLQQEVHCEWPMLELKSGLALQALGQRY